MARLTKRKKVEMVLDHLGELFGSPQDATELMLAQFLRSALREVDYEILDSITTVSGLCDLWLAYRYYPWQKCKSEAGLKAAS